MPWSPKVNSHQESKLHWKRLTSSFIKLTQRKKLWNWKPQQKPKISSQNLALNLGITTGEIERKWTVVGGAGVIN